MKLFKVLLVNNMARSRSEAERSVKEGSVSIGSCIPECEFFTTGGCNCEGWKKVVDPTLEVKAGLAVKISKGHWRLVKRNDGQPGFNQLKGIGRVPEDVQEEKEVHPTGSV